MSRRLTMGDLDAADEEWTMADGTKVRVCNLEVSHMRSILRMIIRQQNADLARRVVKEMTYALDIDF